MTRFDFNRRVLLASGAAWALMARARAADAAPGVEEMRQLVEEGLYQPLWRYVRGRRRSDPSSRWVAAQVAAMTGDEDGAFDVPASQPLAMPDLAGAKVADAIETIAQAARSRRLVILNEAHHLSCCRAFAGRLAARLRAEGFSVFAAETFDNANPRAVEALNTGAAITPALGWYLADPVYAETVRHARALGFRFAAYEARPEQMATAADGQAVEVREDAEANNFIANILARDAKARVFVVCGFDHVQKTQDYNGRMWFAARLKAKTGIDPLCIAQDRTVPSQEAALDDPALKAVLDTFAPAAPVVVFDAQNRPLCLSRPGGLVDVEVIHPRLGDAEGRPGWLAVGRKRAVFALSALTGPRDLIQAVPESEAATANAVPADQYPIALGSREAVFFLRPGRYRIRLETDDGRRELGTLKV